MGKRASRAMAPRETAMKTRGFRVPAVPKGPVKAERGCGAGRPAAPRDARELRHKG